MFQALSEPDIVTVFSESVLFSSVNSATSVFSGTDVFIYVVDLQDLNRYDLALEYFEASVDMFRHLKLEPKKHSDWWFIKP